MEGNEHLEEGEGVWLCSGNRWWIPERLGAVRCQVRPAARAAVVACRAARSRSPSSRTTADGGALNLDAEFCSRACRRVARRDARVVPAALAAAQLRAEHAVEFDSTRRELEAEEEGGGEARAAAPQRGRRSIQRDVLCVSWAVGLTSEEFSPLAASTRGDPPAGQPTVTRRSEAITTLRKQCVWLASDALAGRALLPSAAAAASSSAGKPKLKLGVPAQKPHRPTYQPVSTQRRNSRSHTDDTSPHASSRRCATTSLRRPPT